MILYSIHSSNLIKNNIYIVRTEHGIYKGIYLKQPTNFPYIILSNVISIQYGKKYKFPEKLFYNEELFYCGKTFMNIIKDKSNKAKQQMETRALNKILKRLINEDFQWN
jgi:hypothetical protein